MKKKALMLAFAVALLAGCIIPVPSEPLAPEPMKPPLEGPPPPPPPPPPPR